MIHSSPAKVILIGISLDLRDSAELVSWAIRTLAQPNDTVLALHVLAAEGMKKRVDQKREDIRKWKSITKYQTQIRQAKAFVINVMGEFAKTCQSKQVNLEAKVGFSSSVGKGLIEEAKGISAEFLLIGSSKNPSNKVSHETTRYCFEQAPEGCSIVLVGKSKPPQQDFHSNSIHFKEFTMASSSWSNKKNNTTKSNNSKKMRDQRPSPKTVLDLIEAESQSTTEEFNSSTSSGESTSMAPSPFPLKGKSNFKKRMSPLKIISSFFSNGRKGNDGEFSKKGKHRPLLRCFSYQELAIATNNFHQDNIVGRGGYSEVYRGDLENGHEIAVKRLAKDNKDENKEKEFLVELGIIGHVNHPNTASLVGYCFENGLYLIFNYYSNGTLSSALHGKTGKSMEWGMRYKIAVGIARGLHYLHKCCKHRIIHRDIKASNVLLGPDFEPQISDFGLAKWLPSKWTHHAAIPIEGTFGYLAPEYFVNGIVDEKTDVFAFGILLLEIITGRRPVDSSKQSLLLWAKPLMESEKIEELADPNLEGKYETEQMHRLVLTASYCVRQSSIWRPSMTEVLQLLTYGEGFEMGQSWRLQESVTEEIDDYSMIFGYDLPSDIALEDL